MIEAMWERMAPEEQNRFEEMAARHRRRRDERNDEMRAEAWGDRRFLQTVLTPVRVAEARKGVSEGLPGVLVRRGSGNSACTGDATAAAEAEECAEGMDDGGESGSRGKKGLKGAADSQRRGEDSPREVAGSAAAGSAVGLEGAGLQGGETAGKQRQGREEMEQERGPLGEEAGAAAGAEEDGFAGPLVQLDLVPARYMEVTLHKCAGEDRGADDSLFRQWCVSVGVSVGRSPSTFFKQPGWQESSAGLHSDDGQFFWDNMPRRLKATFGPGDTVGVGVRLDAPLPVLFFTKNGALLPDAFALAGHPLNPPHPAHGGLRDAELYPTIGIDSRCPIAVNCGGEPFVFDLAAARHWPPVRLARRNARRYPDDHARTVYVPHWIDLLYAEHVAEDVSDLEDLEEEFLMEEDAEDEPGEPGEPGEAPPLLGELHGELFALDPLQGDALGHRRAGDVALLSQLAARFAEQGGAGEGAAAGAGASASAGSVASSAVRDSDAFLRRIWTALEKQVFSRQGSWQPAVGAAAAAAAAGHSTDGEEVYDELGERGVSLEEERGAGESEEDDLLDEDDEGEYFPHAYPSEDASIMGLPGDESDSFYDEEDEEDEEDEDEEMFDEDGDEDDL